MRPWRVSGLGEPRAVLFGVVLFGAFLFGVAPSGAAPSELVGSAFKARLASDPHVRPAGDRARVDGQLFPREKSARDRVESCSLPVCQS